SLNDNRRVGRGDTVEVEGRSRTARQAGGVDADPVGTRRDVAEDVVAVALRRRAVDGVATGVKEVHRHIVDSRLAQILHAIAVDVVPHPVAEGAGRLEAEVAGENVLVDDGLGALLRSGGKVVVENAFIPTEV